VTTNMILEEDIQLTDQLFALGLVMEKSMNLALIFIQCSLTSSKLLIQWIEKELARN
jgi:hypothetical protein